MGDDITHHFLVIFTHLPFHNMKIGAGLTLRSCEHITFVGVKMSNYALNVKTALLNVKW